MSDTLAPETAVLVAWRLARSPEGGLVGYCAVELFGGLIIEGIPIFREHDGPLSVGVPTMPSTHPGRATKYYPILRFRGDWRERWRRIVLESLDAGGVIP